MVVGPFDHALSLRSPAFHIPAAVLISTSALWPGLSLVDRVATVAIAILAILAAHAATRGLLLLAVRLKDRLSVRISYLYSLGIYYLMLACTLLWVLIAMKLWRKVGIEESGLRVALVVVPVFMASTIGAGEIVRAHYKPPDRNAPVA